MKRLPFLLAAAAFLAGCSLLGDSGDGASDVTFTTAKNSYLLGQTVTATLKNGSNQAVGYNLCFTALERREGDEWISVGPSIWCQAFMALLKPGEKEQYGVALVDSLDLSVGTYRLVTDVEIDGESVTLATESFGVSVVVQQR